MKEIKHKPVVLVKIPSSLPTYKFPHILDYKNPYIKSVVPCEKVGEKYFDLRSGQEVEVTTNTQVWPTFPGAVFKYQDGQMFIISRRIRDCQLLYLNIKEFHPQSMVLHDVK